MPIQQHNHIILLTFKFKCIECDKAYTQKSNLRRHMKCEHNYMIDLDQAELQKVRRRFGCNDCKKTYSRKKHLNRHVKEHHIAAAKTYECFSCKHSFTRKESLILHMKEYHIVAIFGKPIFLGKICILFANSFC